TSWFRFGKISESHPCNLRLLKIAIEPVTVGVDDRNIGYSRVRIVTNPQQEVGDVTVHRAANLGSVQIDFSLSDLLLHGFERSLCLDCIAFICLLLLWGRRQI